MEKLGWSFPTTGAQDRNAQPEMPVTLHFKGKTFTLSYSQLCQLTGGQPLQLEGIVLFSFQRLFCLNPLEESVWLKALVLNCKVLVGVENISFLSVLLTIRSM